MYLSIFALISFLSHPVNTWSRVDRFPRGIVNVTWDCALMIRDTIPTSITIRLTDEQNQQSPCIPGEVPQHNHELVEPEMKKWASIINDHKKSERKPRFIGALLTAGAAALLGLGELFSWRKITGIQQHMSLVDADLNNVKTDLNGARQEIFRISSVMSNVTRYLATQLDEEICLRNFQDKELKSLLEWAVTQARSFLVVLEQAFFGKLSPLSLSSEDILKLIEKVPGGSFFSDNISLLFRVSEFLITHVTVYPPTISGVLLTPHVHYPTCVGVTTLQALPYLENDTSYIVDTRSLSCDNYLTLPGSPRVCCLTLSRCQRQTGVLLCPHRACTYRSFGSIQKEILTLPTRHLYKNDTVLSHSMAGVWVSILENTLLVTNIPDEAPVIKTFTGGLPVWVPYNDNTFLKFPNHTLQLAENHLEFNTPKTLSVQYVGFQSVLHNLTLTHVSNQLTQNYLDSKKISQEKPLQFFLLYFIISFCILNFCLTLASWMCAGCPLLDRFLNSFKRKRAPPSSSPSN